MSKSKIVKKILHRINTQVSDLSDADYVEVLNEIKENLNELVRVKQDEIDDGLNDHPYLDALYI